MNEAENISKRWICGVNNFYSSQLGVIIFILWKLLQWLKRWKSNNFPWNQKCLRSIASISWTHWCGINLIHQISQLCGITYKQAMKPFVSSIFDGTLTFSSELKKYSESSLGGCLFCHCCSVMKPVFQVTRGKCFPYTLLHPVLCFPRGNILHSCSNATLVFFLFPVSSQGKLSPNSNS